MFRIGLAATAAAAPHGLAPALRRTVATASAAPLNILTFLGSVRRPPPAPARLGERVARAATAQLCARGHDAATVDPMDVWGETTADGFKPHFAYATPPEGLDALAKRIAAADAYVMVSPEYNHSMSPALADLLNHFGASLFARKPSAIVTYSAGQWGGARAAMGMRGFLSELGCLPVSAMVHVGAAHDVLTPDGSFVAESKRWNSFFGRTWDQLEFWAQAARAQRAIARPQPAFKSTPQQRNAPA